MREINRVNYLYINVFGIDNLVGGSELRIAIDIISKNELSDNYQDLHDVLSRIHKFARTELDLYSKEKMSLSYIERLAHAITCYYNLPECIPTPENFDLWIESLEEPMKSDFKNQGFESCKRVLNYLRFILECADIGMDEYLKNHLSPEDYEYYKKPK